MNWLCLCRTSLGVFLRQTPSLTLSPARWDAPFKVPLQNHPPKDSPLQRSTFFGDSSTRWLGMCSSRASGLSIRGRQRTSLRSAWARCSSASFRRVTSAGSMGATRRRAHEGSSGRTFRSLRSFQLPVVDGWRSGSNIGTWMQRVAQDWLVLTQLTHHDASSAGYRDESAVRSAASSSALDGIGSRRLNQRKLLMFTQATMACLRSCWSSHDRRSRPALACVCVRLPVWLCRCVGCSGETGPSWQEMVGDEDLTNAVALNSTSFNAAQMMVRRLPVC